MSIAEAREKTLRDFLVYKPDGAKQLAEAAINCLPYSQLKKLVEVLDLEGEVAKIKTTNQ